MENGLREAALEYHRWPTLGKISVRPTKGLTNQLDLALVYSPGVVAACDLIVENPAIVAEMRSRANPLGATTKGRVVLDLGNIDSLAAKPVMEDKGCLFKKFAGIDVFDIELAENDPDRLIDIIAVMEPTHGGTNLEDINAPECFCIEESPSATRRNLYWPPRCMEENTARYARNTKTCTLGDVLAGRFRCFPRPVCRRGG